MTEIQKLFEKYKYCRVSTAYNGNGVICGYCGSSLLIGYDIPDPDCYKLQEFIRSNPSMVLYHEHPSRDSNIRYSWIKEGYIKSIIEQCNIDGKSVVNDNAEKYIKANFPNISDDDADIYINIFIAGANSVKPRL